MGSEVTSIGIYLREIGEVELLTPAEEVRLAARIKRGDPKAREQMIRANLRLVVKIARDYAQYGLPLLDLISEGNIGLMKAVVRFDPQKGGKLSTYAAWWIKQAIRRALINQGKTIRLPAHMVDKINRMRKTAARLAEKLGREATDQELADELGVPRQKIHMWQRSNLRPTSLDAPVEEGADTSFGDIIGDDRAHTPFEEIADAQLKEEINHLLDRLEYREREILKRRYGLRGAKPATLEDLGVRFKITRERVRQLQNEAVEKLRALLDEMDLPHPVASETPDNAGKA